MNSLKTALANKEIKWKVSSKNPAILLFPVSILYCQQSRGLFYNKYGQCTYNVTLKCVRATVVVMGKQRALHNLNMCILAPFPRMQCACAILSSGACPALQYFFTLSHKRHKFRKKSLITQCVFRFSTILSELFFILTRTERDMIEHVCWSSCKVPVILVLF